RHAARSASLVDGSSSRRRASVELERRRNDCCDRFGRAPRATEALGSRVRRRVRGALSCIGASLVGTAIAIGIGAGGSLLATLLWYSATRLTGFTWSRPVRRFWSNFRNNAVV